jgi:hypothetical protein
LSTSSPSTLSRRLSVDSKVGSQLYRNLVAGILWVFLRFEAQKRAAGR